MFYRIIIVATLFMLIMPSAFAKTILYVPFDDRPVSLEYAVNSVKAAKLDVLTPPVEYLASRSKPGDTEKLWQWVNQNAGKADALVLSADAMIYGGLVDSRTHNWNRIILEWSLRRFTDLHESHPNTPIYVFSTVMRSPSASAGGVEPLYYERYGPEIFLLTALQDKAEVKGLTPDEKIAMQNAKDSIPPEYMADWMDRRDKNFQINSKLIDFTRQGIFKYLVLGRDDTAPFSQTHKEGRELLQLADGLNANRFSSFPGADQLGMVLLARAYNHLMAQTPTVAVYYMIGSGAVTIPSYEDQSIGATIAAHIAAAGGVVNNLFETPDLTLVVNTPVNGHTAEAEAISNMTYVTYAMHDFVNLIAKKIRFGNRVAVADIAYANGSDNSLMQELYEKDLLDKISAYSGWNTASNTLGYAIGQGMMSKTMSDPERKQLLAVRYLDDWAYQANIRTKLYQEVVYPQKGNEEEIALMEPDLTRKLTKEMQLFSTKYRLLSSGNISVSFPWDRMFEIRVEVK